MSFLPIANKIVVNIFVLVTDIDCLAVVLSLSDLVVLQLIDDSYKAIC